MSEFSLFHGNCLAVLPTIPDESVDAIICDLPYGTTACKWDEIIPFESMWDQIKRVIKPHAAIALFCTQPFTSRLIASNLAWFKYCWTWDKARGRGHLVARYRPMQSTEEVAVFGKARVNYYPQMTEYEKPRFAKEGTRTTIMGGKKNANYEGRMLTHRHPTTLIRMPWTQKESGLHPTQKPVSLLEYLIHTYTKEGDTVLDFTMGSGSTGVAAARTNRNFIGIELDDGYFATARDRIENTMIQAELTIAP